MKKYTVSISNQNISFTVNEGEHIVSGIVRHDCRHKANGCCNGGCGACKIKILSGEFKTKKWSKAQVTDEEFQEGYALGCKVFPTSDMLIEYVGNKK